MSFREHEKRCDEFGRQQALERAPKTPPGPWSAMLDTWSALLVSLCAVLGPSSPLQERGGEPLARLAPVPRWMRVWEMMWSLPPCSEARKAAFTLGAAAMMIERWRVACLARARDEQERYANREHVEADPTAEAFTARLEAHLAIGQRAESLLRIAAWHIEDAKIEASSPARRPGIPQHVRIYAHSQFVDPERGGVNFCGVMNDSDRRRVTLAMLDDFVRQASERKTLKPSDDALIALAPALVETLGASLPAGPWIVTSQDVWRFLAELLVDAT